MLRVVESGRVAERAGGSCSVADGPGRTHSRDVRLRSSRSGSREPSGSNGHYIGTLCGHFSVFNRWTEINSPAEGRFLERIAPGAFRRTFESNRSGMRCLMQHGRDPVVGMKPLGPIRELEEDAVGAAYGVPLLDTSYNRDLLPGVRAGVYGASFRFQVMVEEVDPKPPRSAHNPAGIEERTIRECRVREFGPVTFGAYPEASAGMRSRSTASSPPSCTETGRPLRRHRFDFKPDFGRERWRLHDDVSAEVWFDSREPRTAFYSGDDWGSPSIRLTPAHDELVEVLDRTEGAVTETGGVLFGRVRWGKWSWVIEVLGCSEPGLNAVREPGRYVSDGGHDFDVVQRFREERGLEPIGFHHSHPNGYRSCSSQDIRGWPKKRSLLGVRRSVELISVPTKTGWSFEGFMVTGAWTPGGKDRIQRAFVRSAADWQ